MAEEYILGDGSINIWYDNFVIPVPKVDGAFTAARALVLCCDAERHIVGSFLQFQTSLEVNITWSMHLFTTT